MVVSFHRHSPLRNITKTIATNKTLPQSGKYNSSEHISKRSANAYDRSDLKLMRSTSEKQLGIGA